MQDINHYELQAVYDYIMERAAVDVSFRQALLRSPKQILEQEFDIQLPDYFSIRFIERQGADVTVVLPDTNSVDLVDENIHIPDIIPNFFLPFQLIKGEA